MYNKIKPARNVIKKIGMFMLIGTVLLSGCNKELDIDSTHLVNESNNWKSLADARSALLGSYGLLRAALADNNAHWLYGDLRMGDFKATSRLDLKAVTENNLNAPYPVVKSLSNWRKFYAVINSCTVFIDRAGEILKNDKQYTEENYKIDVAQMRALRAFTYFYMARIWGDIPLITASTDGNFIERPKVASEIVLQFATSELLAAVNALPYRYGALQNGLNQQSYYGKVAPYWDGILLNRISAYAILAHIAAWQGKYLDAVAYAKFVMTNFGLSGAIYTTTPNLTKVDGLFYGNNASQLVGFPFNYNTAEMSAVGHIEDLALAAPIISKAVPQIKMPDDVIAGIFNEANDLRFRFDPLTGLPVSDYFSGYGTSNTVFSKIKCIRNASTDGTLAIYSSALVFTRMEEITLLYAESLAAIGSMDEATDALDIVRNSRGIGLYKGTNAGLIDAIFAERRRELMGEGWRWYDLVRYNKLKNSDPKFTDLIKKGGIYWPIDEEVLSTNAKITQNEYWR